MNIREIHKAFIAYRFTLFITLVVFVVLRFSDGFSTEFPETLCWHWASVHLWITSLLQIGIAFLLLYFSQRFGIIRHKSLLPAFFYLLLVGTSPVTWDILLDLVPSIIIILCLLFTLLSYQRPESQRYAFNISLLLTVGSFVWQPILLFLPLFWCGMFRFQSLNWKTFFASLMGFAVIYLFLFTYAVYQNDWAFFVDTLPTAWEVFNPLQLPDLSVTEWVRIGFIFLLFLLSGIRIFMSSVSEKIQTISILDYLYLCSFVLFIAYLLASEGRATLLLILYIPLTLLFSHYFTMAMKRWTSWLFLFSIVFFLILYFIN